ncbi:hypothetical protein RYX36_033024 [Vicia faba]
MGLIPNQICNLIKSFLRINSHFRSIQSFKGQDNARLDERKGQHCILQKAQVSSHSEPMRQIHFKTSISEFKQLPEFGYLALIKLSRNDWNIFSPSPFSMYSDKVNSKNNRQFEQQNIVLSNNPHWVV